VKGDGKQSNWLAEISDYIGNRREMEDSKSVPVGSPVKSQYPLAFRYNRGNKKRFKKCSLSSPKCSGSHCIPPLPSSLSLSLSLIHQIEPDDGDRGDLRNVGFYFSIDMSDVSRIFQHMIQVTGRITESEDYCLLERDAAV
jgi:hypothetical protein